MKIKHFLWLMLAAMTGWVAPAKAIDFQRIQLRLPAPFTNAAMIGPLDAATNLDLAIALPWRNPETLSNLLHAISDPASPQFRHYLTPAQFAEEFGPTQADYDALIAFAAVNGLTVTATHPNRMLLDVRGSVANINRAFHVTMNSFRHPTEGRNFYAPDSVPTVNLAVRLLGVSGFENYSLPRPRHVARPVSLVKNGIPNAGTGPGGTYMGRDFRSAFVPGSHFDGAGQAVGLLQFDGYHPSDIAYYADQAGLPSVTLSNVLLNGVTGTPSGGGGEVEVSLDIEMAISMAPGLSMVIVYEGASWHDILNRMATDNLAKQLSCSWYSPGMGADPVADQIWKQMAAQGQSFYNASGDNDAYTGLIDFPGDTPYITQVGGTTLTMTNGSYASEVVWNWGNGVGTGGGVSTSYPIPYWQTNINMTANLGSTNMRNIPDVALPADNIYVRADGRDYNVGGTSCSAPLWAGLTALINQVARTNGEPTVGLVNPAVYALAQGGRYAACFHDITVGDNRWSGSGARFPAAPGYDLCTGWGTPTGEALLYALGVPEPLQISPKNDALFTGPVGGPFAPLSQAMSLTNSAGAPLHWSVVNTSPWLTVSPAGGILVTGGPAQNLTLTLAPSAAQLGPGRYEAILWFTNLNNNFAQNRRVTLAVVTPPTITQQPGNQALLEGETARFDVLTASNALMYYQWQLDNGSAVSALQEGGQLSGTRSSTLLIANVAPTNQGAYSVIVSNAAGVAVSANAYLAILPWRPVIRQQPVSQTVLPGAPAAFTVAAVGTHPFSYRWRFNGTNLVDGPNISGSATDTLKLLSTASSMVGKYSVIISNALGLTPSADAVLDLIPVTAPGVDLTTVHSFNSDSSGAIPYSPLVLARDGNFYGTTTSGGTNGWGTIFRLSPGGTLTTLFSFNYSNGGYPYGGLCVASNGFLYGTTAFGGGAGYGTIFRMTTNGVLTTIASFDGVNGYYSAAGLLQGSDGNLYGTTIYGGVQGLGNVFRVTTSGAITSIYSFDGLNGAYPSCVLAQDKAGNLYGTTENGGSSGGGNVFKLTLGGQFIELKAFNYQDGASPVAGVVLDIYGNLYGTTEYGGTSGYGTVFKVTPDGAYRQLYSFGNGDDGANPFGGLVVAMDGNLYGTTSYGGKYAAGTLFRISPNGILATLAQFDGFQGGAPAATLVQGPDYSLYGTATSGGLFGNGTIFKLGISGPMQITGQPVNQQVYLGDHAQFEVATFGSMPVAYQWRKNGTNLVDGGGLSGATNRVLSITDAGLANVGNYSVAVSNLYGSAVSASAVLQLVISTPFIVEQPEDQTILVGSTAELSVAVVGDMPLVFQWQKNGTNLIDGGRITGAHSSTLRIKNTIQADSGVYSVVVNNDLFWVQSADARLAVVPTVANGYTMATLHAFGSGIDGIYPYAGLIQGRNGMLYGNAVVGGRIGQGSIYRIQTNGSYAQLFSFTGGSDGAAPYASLLQATNDFLYGTTTAGGTNSQGTIYRVNLAGQLVGLYSFTGGADGGTGQAGLIQGSDGDFYGMAESGGVNSLGTIFRITASGVFTTLYTFSGEDGAYPYGTLLQAADGNIYGTTSSGGEFYSGNIFSITPAGVFTSLYRFTGGTDGAYPLAALIQGRDGNFYGTTYQGGTNGFGTVFKFTTNGILTTLHSFEHTDGAHPFAGLVQAANGNFYGATEIGGLNDGGTVYQITPDGEFTTIVHFNSSNGASPEGTLLQATDGNLFGTTLYGGANHAGLVYKLTVPVPPQIITQPTNVVAFVGSSTSFQVSVIGTAPLTYQWQFNGTNLVNGDTVDGATAPKLSISEVEPSNAGTYSVLLSNAFGGIASTNATLTVLPVTAPGYTLSTLTGFPGGHPNGLVAGSNGSLYGTTRSGGAMAQGSVFQISPNQFFTNLYSFTGGDDGGTPMGSLTRGASGVYYGSTAAGGPAAIGSVFQISSSGAFSSWYAFPNATNGQMPAGPLVQTADGSWYGTTREGGGYEMGTVFHLDSNGQYSQLHAFAGPDGDDPWSGVIYASDGKFYGTTESGGSSNRGTIFCFGAGGQFTNLYSFTGGVDGGNPRGGLVQGMDGAFYGTTYSGGMSGNGTVFRLTAGGVLHTLLSFNFTNGAQPSATLIQGGDGLLYGSTEAGGLGGAGTVFALTTDGSISVLTWFYGANGASPQAALTWGQDGNLYGTTAEGGVNGNGTVFQLAVPHASLHVSAGSAVAGLGQLHLSWEALPGQSFQIQYKPNLATAVWANHGMPISATNEDIVAIDLSVTNRQGYYRVILLPSGIMSP